LLRSRLDQIIDMGHEKVVLAGRIDWQFLSDQCGQAYSAKPGHPALPTRLMAGLHILKYTDNLSDEEVCARFVENPYYQYFCGEEFFHHDLPLERSSMTRWRQRMGEDAMQALLQESLAVAVKLGAARLSDFTQVIVDTTVQEKNVAFPTDAKLINRAREKLVRQAKAAGLKLRQSYVRVGKWALILCPCQTVQAGAQAAAQAEDLARPHRARHPPPDKGQHRTGGRLPAAPVAGRTGDDPEAARRYPEEGLLAARPGGGMHRQGESSQAV